MSEIENCEYSEMIMEEPVCNAFDVNRYGEIICSEESCIILKLKEQLQAKEQECEELKFTLNHTGLLDLMNENAKLKQAEQKLTELKERYEKLKKSNSDYATAVLKRNLKLEKIKEKWQKFVQLSPLELAANAKKHWS